jgi:hypothetical protein
MHKLNLADFASGFQPVIGVPISIRPLRADDFDRLNIIGALFLNDGQRDSTENCH